MGTVFRFIMFVIVGILVGCSENNELTSSLWYHTSKDNTAYHEILVLDQNDATIIFPITEDGIKPSKELVKEGNGYITQDGITITVANSMNQLSLGYTNSEVIFKKFRNLKTKSSYETLIDSFFIRKRDMLIDSTDYFYKSKTMDFK